MDIRENRIETVIQADAMTYISFLYARRWTFVVSSEKHKNVDVVDVVLCVAA